MRAPLTARICDPRAMIEIPSAYRAFVVEHEAGVAPAVRTLSSAALAGGGIQGGRVVGASDKQGAFPAENPKTAQDVLATMYRHLGIDVTKNYDDLQGRPHPILPRGTPMDELFA